MANSFNVNDILGRTNATFQFRKTTEKIESSKVISSQIIGNTKYKSIADADKAGVRKSLDELTQDVTALAKYKLNINLVSPMLDDQIKAMSEIQAVMVKFNEDDIRANTVGETKQIIADRTLDNLEKILTRKVNGDYIFGGKYSKDNPIIHSLKANTNVIGTVNTTNYTNSSFDDSKLPISDEETINVHNIAASDPVIADFIGLVNFYKVGGDINVISDRFIETNKAFGKRSIAIEDEKAKIDVANLANTKADEIAKNRASLLEAADVVELSSRFRDLISSVGADFAITAAVQGMFDKMVASAA